MLNVITDDPSPRAAIEQASIMLKKALSDWQRNDNDDKISLDITLAEVKTPARRKYPPVGMNDYVIKPHGG
jgi:hypothetical protein